jgi:hypothetical protein
MAACPKCGLEKGCPCGWGVGSDGIKVCPTCCAQSYSTQTEAPLPQNNNPIGIQPQSIVYQHNYT